MTPIRSAFAAGLVLFLSACSGSVPPAEAPAPGAAPASSADEVLRHCGALREADHAACYEQSLLGVLRAEGVAAAMRLLQEMSDRDPALRRDGHVYAHAVGLAAYSPDEEVARTFNQCTPAFQSGCYHGVIQSYFADHAAQHGPEHLDAETVNALCRDYRDDPAARWLLFQCAHGMGHGLTALANHHLPRALGGCDLVENGWEREACYGGALMENIVQATAPHHGVGRPHAGGHAGAAPAAAGDHAHHAEHAAGPAAEPFPALDPDDPLYPCSALEDRYLISCYQMQTSVMLHLNGGDFAAAAQTCGRVPESFRYWCFQSLGRDISGWTLQDHERAIRLCSLAEAAYRPACHDGYAKNLVDLTARAEDGLAYCRLLPAGEEEGKRRCYEAVGEQIWALAHEAPRREEMCGAAEPGYLAACRKGAGL